MVNLKILITYFVLLSFIISCKTSENVNKPIATSLNKTVELISSSEVKKGTTIYFQFVNNSSKIITIHHPAKKGIEKFENDQWRNVRILYCPCGADCIPPPKVKMIKSGEKHDYSWNLIEAWCDKKKGNNVQRTVEHKSLEGLYRTKVRYSIDNEIIEITKEFKITN